MAWYESNVGGGGGAGLTATEVVIITAEYTSEPLPVEQANALLGNSLLMSSSPSEPEEDSEELESEPEELGE